jgi:glutamate synthase (NADPH/NADH)
MVTNEAVNEEYTPFNYQETLENKSWASALPVKQGLYDPEF